MCSVTKRRLSPSCRILGLTRLVKNLHSPRNDENKEKQNNAKQNEKIGQSRQRKSVWKNSTQNIKGDHKNLLAYTKQRER